MPPKTFQLTIKRVTKLPNSYNNTTVCLEAFKSSSKCLWRSKEAKIQGDTVSFVESKAYLCTIDKKKKPKHSYLKFKLRVGSKTISKWKIDLIDFWEKNNDVNTLIFKKGPVLTLNIIDTSAPVTHGMPQKPSKNKSKRRSVSLPKPRGSDSSDEDDQSFSFSDTESMDQMDFEECSFAEKDEKKPPKENKSTYNELPPLVFDLNSLADGRFTSSIGVNDPVVDLNPRPTQSFNTTSSFVSSTSVVQQRPNMAMPPPSESSKLVGKKNKKYNKKESSEEYENQNDENEEDENSEDGSQKDGHCTCCCC